MSNEKKTKNTKWDATLAQSESQSNAGSQINLSQNSLRSKANAAPDSQETPSQASGLVTPFFLL